LTYNLFHNAGPIYDTVIDMVDVFRFGDPSYRYYWRTIGNGVGYILKMISYKPNNFNPFDGKKPVPNGPKRFY
jgi:hypothetical protein